jgi:tetratricopeptide (TPR) repeat protein
VLTPERGPQRPAARTLLEAEIRERNLTLEEFVEYAETITREHPDTGTLSLRHLQRLIAGADPDRIRPATKRLLERIFTIPVKDLLAPPADIRNPELDDQLRQNGAELGRLITTAQRIDQAAIQLFADQIDTIRKIDRRFGAAQLLGALRQHAQHIEELLNHGIGGPHDRALAAVLTDAHTLAGWQSLDRGEITAAWRHYRQACDAARTADSPALLAHALAEQAVVLTDIDRTTDAAQLSGHARTIAAGSPPLLQSWLAAAHGEALAAADQADASLRTFDTAHEMLPALPGWLAEGPYLALDDVHLARWRGYALAHVGHPDATTVLRQTLHRHDAEFTRAEAGLRTDLVLAHLAAGQHDEARHELSAALETADVVGSIRQRRRLARASAALPS